MKHIVILGGGVTGLTLAWKLSEKYGDRIVLLEKEQQAGGLAKTIERDGLRLDLGSHRIHKNYDPEVLNIIREFLGDDLLKRPRRGQIYLGGKFLNYPPTVISVLFSFGFIQFLSLGWDYLLTNFSNLLSSKKSEENFKSYITSHYGRKLYDLFYMPYAKKLWGIDPERISFEPAKNRSKKFHVKNVIKELCSLFFGASKEYYFYPAKGIGQIADELKERFLRNGGRLENIKRIDPVEVDASGKIVACSYENQKGFTGEVEVELMVSTIPLDAIYELIQFSNESSPKPDFPLKNRSLKILYLVMDDFKLGNNETFYVPDLRYRIGRVSEMSRYSPQLNNKKKVLTVELTCSMGDDIQTMSDDDLASLCIDELQQLGILKKGQFNKPEVFSRTIPNLYPVYSLGWKESYRGVMKRFGLIKNFYLIGRSALFLHCSIDQCMMMALRMSEFIISKKSKSSWDEISKNFLNFNLKD